jgi:hypothetical protein
VKSEGDVAGGEMSALAVTMPDCPGSIETRSAAEFENEPEGGSFDDSRVAWVAAQEPESGKSWVAVKVNEE